MGSSSSTTAFGSPTEVHLSRTALNYSIEIPESKLRKTAVNRDAAALLAMYEGKPLHVREVARQWGVSVANASGRLKRLRAAGRATKVGPQTGTLTRWEPTETNRPTSRGRLKNAS
jgi:hypothetical protein